MQREHRPDQRREIDHHGRIVRPDPERLAQLRISSQLRQQSHDLLELTEDLVVDRQLALSDVVEVLANILQPGVQTTQRGELRGDAGGKGLGGEERGGGGG
jgi:hypothetical protein